MNRFIAQTGTIVLIVCTIFFVPYSRAQNNNSPGVPVVVSGDTLFFVRTNIGPFTAEQRVKEITRKIDFVIRKEENADSIKSEEFRGYTNVTLKRRILLSVTDVDAALAGRSRADYTKEIISLIRQKVNAETDQYSSRRLLINGSIALGLFLLLLLILWIFTKIFPAGYEFMEKLEGKVFKPIKYKTHEIVSPENISALFIVLLKGTRLAIILGLFYFYLVYVFSLFPWTRPLNIKPVLTGVISSLALFIITFAVLKSIYTFLNTLNRKAGHWKGTLIKSVKVKNLEVVSEERIYEQVILSIKIFRFIISIITGYFFVTILFSFFSFSKNWASTLISYILDPLKSVAQSFISFLPNLFTIIVIVFVTRYVLKFIRFVFNEIARGSITFQKFPADWAEPTYKIVRFMLMAFAAVVIFPYLPGSSSPAFQGISVFLGILFSFGSSSAISNMVAGVVLTYMRPFRIGDRVKIADTMGDIIEKTLLVTRVRTIKNVDISIPNSMVLGSHIINFSSSAKEKGLILHTTVTIGYDVPWKKVHELLIAAAKSSDNILDNPAPFILQTSLDDSYVSYELNAYTGSPGTMAKTYSEIHQNIQDRFNEAGIEIMSPHYSAVRDGNQTAIPEDYLPKGYRPKPFRILPFSGLRSEGKEEEK